MNQKLMTENVPGTHLGRHPNGTEIYRHGKVKHRMPDRVVPGGEVSVRHVAPKPRTGERKFPWHLMGR